MPKDPADDGRLFEERDQAQAAANGRSVFNGRVDPSVATLLKWAARDNDRTSCGDCGLDRLDAGAPEGDGAPPRPPTKRQENRQATRSIQPARSRGWTREELYVRGRTR